jgi:thioredoxin 2
MAAPIVTCPNCGTRNRLPRSAEGVPRCGSCHAPLPWLVDVDAGGFEAAIRA